MLRPGDLIHRVTIKTPSTDVDDSGHSTGYDVFKANVPARVVQSSGREYRGQERTVDVRTVKVIMRYLPGILGKMRVYWTPPQFSEEQILEITEILNPDGKGIEHNLTCIEVANG